MNKLLCSSISVLNQVYKEKAIVPIALAKACFERIEKTGYLNAYTNVTRTVGEQHACESNRRFTLDKKIGVLDGVPISIKDNFCTKSIPTTCASNMLLNFKPTYDATVYTKLRDAGAIIVGKTNMDEFAMGCSTVHSVFGPTRNPHGGKANDDNFHICGGSSGGAAVAVASGSCYASIGTDTGGSIRNPASYCGLVGLKPTYGVISRYGIIPLAECLDTVGIITRTINDCIIVYNHITGPDDKDSTTRKKVLNPIVLPPKLNLKGLKIGIPKEYRHEYLMESVLHAWDHVAYLLKDHGAEVVEVSLPNMPLSSICYYIINCCAVSSNMSCYDGLRYGHRAANAEGSIEELYTKSRTEAFNDVVKSRIIAGNYFLLQENYEKYYMQAAKLRRIITNDFYEVFKKVHLILTPTNLTTAKSLKDFMSKDDRSQNVIEDLFTVPANLAGIPALTVPVKLSKDKLPISVQFQGPVCSERALFCVGKIVEEAVKFPKQCLEF